MKQSMRQEDFVKCVASTLQVKEFNRENGELPFKYICAANDKITWTVGEDEEGRITSVFSFSGNSKEEKDRNITYLESKEDAIKIKKHLLDDGWIPAKNQEITLSSPGMQKMKVGSVTLNRRQRRNFKKNMDIISNPKESKNKQKELQKKLERKISEGGRESRDPRSSSSKNI